jgi:hypothetical protein
MIFAAADPSGRRHKSEIEKFSQKSPFSPKTDSHSNLQKTSI